MRNLKKPSFWIAAILIPIGFALYMGVAALVGYNVGETIEAGTATSDLKLGVYDEAQYLSSTKFMNSDEKEQELTVQESKDAGIAAVKDKKIDVFYYISKDFAETNKVEIYAKPEYSSITDDFSMPIRTLMATTAAINVDKIDFAVITGAVNYETTTFGYNDNHVIDASERVKEVMGPALALACFYILMVVLGNRLTSAMVEEKENRISELILTSIKPVNLIVGKIISLMIVGLIQLIILVAPMLALYEIGQNGNLLPEWFQLSFDFVSLAQYALLLIGSYFLFTALSVIVGVISPTARDASSYSSMMVIMVILPIFFVDVFMPAGTSTLTYVLSYFPPSAPIALMLRGIFGNLPTWEFWLGLADIAIFGFLAAKLATYIYCKNAIEFTSKINFKKLFGTPRKQWKK